MAESPNSNPLQDEMNEMIALAAEGSEDKMRALLLNDEVNALKIKAEDEDVRLRAARKHETTPELNDEMNEMIALVAEGSADNVRALLLNDEVTAIKSAEPGSGKKPVVPGEDAESYLKAKKLREEMDEMTALAADGSEDYMRVLLLHDEIMERDQGN